MADKVFTLIVVCLLVFAAVLGYRVYHAGHEADAVRQSLNELETEHRRLGQRLEDLRAQYNEAVRRTAVTELLVADGRLSVRIRSVRGTEAVLPTPFDPSREIYVDFAVINGRAWIRRIFDSQTAPGHAMVIDPLVEQIDWSEHPDGRGQAVYRSLTPGRWVVTVTGNGALDLRRAGTDEPMELSDPPAVRDYEPGP